MNGPHAGALVALGGGVVLLISTFLDWIGTSFIGFSVYESEIYGFAGVILLLLALDTIVTAAILAFGSRATFPDRILGFTVEQLVVSVGFMVFVYGFAMTFVDESKFGAILCWLAGAAIAVGGFMEERQAGSSSGTGDARRI